MSNLSEIAIFFSNRRGRYGKAQTTRSNRAHTVDDEFHVYSLERGRDYLHILYDGTSEPDASLLLLNAAMILRLNQLVNRTNVQKHYRSDGSRITVSKKRKVVLIWSSETVGVRVDPFARKRQVVQVEGSFNPGGEWTAGNLAIRDHIEEGFHVLLFEPAPSDSYRFLGRFGYLSHEEMEIQRSGGRGTRPIFRLSTTESWLELSLKSADQTLVDSAARAVTKVVTQYEAESWGPIPLPSKKGQYKSKDESMVDTVKHRRRLWLRDPQPAMIAELSGITLPGGVDVELKQSGATVLEPDAAPAS